MCQTLYWFSLRGHWHRTGCLGGGQALRTSSGVPNVPVRVSDLLIYGEIKSCLLPLPCGQDKSKKTKLIIPFSCFFQHLPLGLMESPLWAEGPEATAGHREDRTASVSPDPEGPLLPFVSAMTLSQPRGGKHQGIWDRIQVSQNIHFTIRSQHWSNLF